jgi:hypothetical protein
MNEGAWKKFNELYFREYGKTWGEALWEALQAARKVGVPIEEFKRQTMDALKAKIQWQKDEGIWER